MNQHRHMRSPEGLITRSFKSGNSVALRLPKELGFQAGEEVVITGHEDGTFSLRRASDKVAALDALYGAFSSGFMAKGRGDMEQIDRDWSTSKPEPTSD